MYLPQQPPSDHRCIRRQHTVLPSHRPTRTPNTATCPLPAFAWSSRSGSCWLPAAHVLRQPGTAWKNRYPKSSAARVLGSIVRSGSTLMLLALPCYQGCLETRAAHSLFTLAFRVSNTVVKPTCMKHSVIDAPPCARMPVRGRRAC